MKFITLATVAALVSAALGLTVNTPTNVVECEPTQLVWSGGVAPYYLTFVPARQTTAPPIKSFPTQSGTTLTWLVDLAAGESFTIALKDSTGATAYSDIVTVVAGVSSNCLNSSVQETGSGGSSSGGSASATSGGSSASASGSSASSTSTASGSSSTKSSGADRLGVSAAFGVAGLVGLMGAALL